MVAEYFHRLNDNALLTVKNFYLLLHLANEMTNDFEMQYYPIASWAIKQDSYIVDETLVYTEFTEPKIELLKLINWRAHVTVDQIEKVIYF